VSDWLGLELQRMREERGLTVEGLAEKSGVSASTIRGVERGARKARIDTANHAHSGSS
jgi:transcriptional regulator with XRE-family HTH domain